MCHRISCMVSHFLYHGERFAVCLAATSLVTCLVLTIIMVLMVGVGLGYNYCYVDVKSQKLTNYNPGHPGSFRRTAPQGPFDTTTTTPIDIVFRSGQERFTSIGLFSPYFRGYHKTSRTHLEEIPLSKNEYKKLNRQFIHYPTRTNLLKFTTGTPQYSILNTQYFQATNKTVVTESNKTIEAEQDTVLVAFESSTNNTNTTSTNEKFAWKEDDFVFPDRATKADKTKATDELDEWEEQMWDNLPEDSILKKHSVVSDEKHRRVSASTQRTNTQKRVLSINGLDLMALLSQLRAENRNYSLQILTS